MNETISSITKQRILLSPLNWGLGHVSRCVALIEVLKKQGNELIVCCTSDQEEFLREYFPELWYVEHDGYPFQFKGDGSFIKDVSFAYPKLKRRLDKELFEVKKLVEIFQPDLIISDQRFGFRSKKVRSVIISHQLSLPLPKYAFLAQFINAKYLKRFDEIWVPDNEECLSGNLSKSSIKHLKIGLLSRFKKKVEHTDIKYKYVVVVSGPMPYARNFLLEMSARLSKLEGKHAIIAGLESFDYAANKEGVEIYYQPSKEWLLRLFSESEIVISRSGYSTLMDLVCLKKRALLIPTKGQAEQEYLARHNKGREGFTFVSEEDFKNYPL